MLPADGALRDVPTDLRALDTTLPVTPMPDDSSSPAAAAATAADAAATLADDDAADRDVMTPSRDVTGALAVAGTASRRVVSGSSPADPDISLTNGRVHCEAPVR